jgi:hypothetical protein
MQGCPLLATLPCDVNKLKIKVKTWAPDETEELTFELETTKVRRTETLRDVKERTAEKLLHTYDLLIDCLAEPDVASASHPAPMAAEVEAHAFYTTPRCETQSHALLTMAELDKHQDVIEKRIGASELEIDKQKFYAVPSFIDRVDKQTEILDKITTFFGIIKGFMDVAMGVKTEVVVRAVACGTRGPGDGGDLNATLLACVRVYRRSRWAIGIKTPGLGTFKFENERTRDLREVNRQKTIDTSAGFNFYKNRNTHETSGEGLLAEYKYTKKRQLGGTVDAYEQSRKVEHGSEKKTFKEEHRRGPGHKSVTENGHLTYEEITKRLHRDTGFQVMIAFDDHEIEIPEGIEQIKEQIEKIREGITSLRNFLEKAPQIGWKFTFDVAVLSGFIAVECAPEYVPRARAGGRYYALEHKFRGIIELTVIALTLTASYGVDVQALDSGLVVKIQLTLSIKADVTKEINMGFFNRHQEFDVSADGDVDVSAIGYVNLLGKTIADGRLGVSAGAELRAKLEIDLPTRNFDLKGKLMRKEIVLYGYIRCPYLWDKKIPPKKLLEAGPWHTFG